MYVLERKKEIKRLIATFCLAVAVLLIFRGREVSQKTYEGLLFSARYIISSVFPFIFLCNILIDTEALESLSKKFTPLMLKMKLNLYILPPFLISIFCGFPTGAIYISELYEKGLLSKKESDVLLPMCNNPSPAFVISTVGSVFLHSQSAGVILWILNVFFSCLLSFMFLPKNIKEKTVLKVKAKDYSFSESFVKSIKQSVKSALNIGGTVTVFYLISDFTAEFLEKSNLPEALTAFFISILEIGNGCMFGADLESLRSTLCAFAVGFGGLCVAFQVKAAHKDSSMAFYFFSKVMCGLLCAFFAYFLL